MYRQRVLIASDQFHWTINFVHGYKANGWDCIVGIQNFNAEAIEIDLVHLNWPEEFSSWRPPSDDQICQITEKLTRWKSRARIILTVNNLYPHGNKNDVAYRKLYDRFYELADVIHHQSQVSFDLVNARHAAARDKQSVIMGGFNYDLLLPDQPVSREASRKRLGIRADETVFLFFGAVRSEDELNFLRRGIEGLRVSNKRLISAINLVPRGSTGLQWRWSVSQWRRWLKRTGAIASEGFLPDNEVFPLFNACDVVVIVRRDGLTSGLPALALTMSRLAVAPRLGATAELLTGTENLLYDPESLHEFQVALYKAATVDRSSVEENNRRLSQRWSWDLIIRKCLDAL